MAKASAGAVTRALKAEGFTKSEYHASGQVKGWGDRTTGFESRQRGDEAYVEWTLGGFWRMPREERDANATEKLTSIRAALEKKGYACELEDGSFGPRLKVTKG